MLYRTKAAMEILMDLNAKEAFELFKMVRHIQKRFYIGTRMIPFDKIPKDDAHDRILCILNDGTLDIPAQLRGPLERFLEVMVEERAPMDMLVEEYNTALSRVFQPDLFKPEAMQDGLTDRPEPAPEASAKGPDISFSGTVVDGDTTGTDKEGTGGSEHIRDEMIDLMVERGLSFHGMIPVFEKILDTLDSIQGAYKEMVDETPVKELRKIWKGKEERWTKRGMTAQTGQECTDIMA